MAVNIIVYGNYTLAPLNTVTLSATSEGEKLEQQVREICERWNAHEPVVQNLIERIDALATWGTTWPDYDADPPTAATVERARGWMEQLYLDVVTNGRTWVDPLIVATEEGAASFAWKHRDRDLEVEIDETTAKYSKSWGTEPDFEFEDGPADTRHRRLSLWAWLAG
jgi:hypothetical protein